MNLPIIRPLISYSLALALSFSSLSQGPVCLEIRSFQRPPVSKESSDSTDLTVYEANESQGNSEALTQQQLSSIMMLNYLTVLTEEINEAKDNRLILEDVYSSLINNTYPNAVDVNTQLHLTSLLDTINSYRMVDVKRERIQQLYEQSKVKAFRSVFPEPKAILEIGTSISTFDYLGAIVLGVRLTVGSIAEYQSEMAKMEADYLTKNLELSDKQADTLHESRKNAFVYMLGIVRDNNLPGSLALSEENVEEFVSWKNNTNVAARILFLESNQPTYQAFGSYWLLLAESYYDNEEYEKCLDAVFTYQNLDVRIFRKDTALARILPLAIVSAEKEYSDNLRLRVSTVTDYLNVLLENTSNSDWDLKYFAAQSYMSLYRQTQKKEYLQKAFNLSMENVNSLTGEQLRRNREYLADLEKRKAPEGASSQEKKDINNYNKLVKEERKTELPPVSEPLVLNCDLLFSLAHELNLSSSDKKVINGILHNSGESLFLNEALDSHYWFDHGSSYSDDLSSFEGDTLILPASLVSSKSVITVTVTDRGKSTAYTDWEITKVDRGKKGGTDTYKAYFRSKELSKVTFTKDAAVLVEILPHSSSNCEPVYLKFVVDKKTHILLYDHTTFVREQEE